MNPAGEDQKAKTARHAFIMGDGLVFIADIPDDWRYVFSSIYEYDLLAKRVENTEKDCQIQFIGYGNGDGTDNFF